MPLIPGQGSAVRSKNIGELVKSGRPVKQAVAIAYSEQRRGKRKDPMTSLKERMKARGVSVR